MCDNNSRAPRRVKKGSFSFYSPVPGHLLLDPVGRLLPVHLPHQVDLVAGDHDRDVLREGEGESWENVRKKVKQQVQRSGRDQYLV